MRGKITRARVLVLENDSILAALLKKLLQLLDCEVVLLTGQEAGMEYVPEEIDLVVVDLDGPSCSSGPLLDRLAMLYPLASVILLVPRGSTGVARMSGAESLVEKPLQPLALVRKIKESLSTPRPISRCYARRNPLERTHLAPRGPWGAKRCAAENGSLRLDARTSASPSETAKNRETGK